MALVLKKYFSLFISILKTSFVADLEFRANFTFRVFTDIIWYLMQILSFEVIFNFAPKIGDWNRVEMRVFLSVLFVTDSFYMIFFQENIDRIADKVRKGELDLLLVKPASSQFLVSFHKVSVASFTNLFMSIGFLTFTLSQLPQFQWFTLISLVLTIPTSICIVYSLRFMFACLSLIFVRSESIQFVWYNLYRFGMRPNSIYNPIMKLFLMTILPVGFIASIPAQFLIEQFDILLFIWTLIIGPLFLYMSHLFWNYCLRFYSSASS